MSKDHIDKAMRAHTNLTVFDTVQNVLNQLYGGSPQADRAAAQISKICKKAMQDQLRLMDDATAKIHHGAKDA